MGAKDNLLKLLGGSEGVKETRRLTRGASDKEEAMRVLSEQTGVAPLRLGLTFDTTGSMGYIISAVRDVASHVGTEILSAERGIEAYVLGVGDHGDKNEIVRARGITGLKMLGDYGQDNMPTTEVEAFVRQVNSIVETNGGDIPEAYECLAKDLCERMMKDKQAAPQRKNIVVFFGDSMPHGKRGNYSEGREDRGCPYQIDARQLTALGTLADHSYWVDCTDFASTVSRVFRQHTFSHLEGLSNATYLRFADAEGVLPEAIIGMVRKAQGAEELQKYLAQLEAGNGGKAAQVAGLLTGKK